MPEQLVFLEASEVECFECTALDYGVEGLLVYFCRRVSIQFGEQNLETNSTSFQMLGHGKSTFDSRIQSRELSI